MAPKLTVFLIWRFLYIRKKLKINSVKSKRYSTRYSGVILDLCTNRAQRRSACKFEMGLRASDCTMAVSEIRSTFSCFYFTTKSSHLVLVLALSCFLFPNSGCSDRIGFHFHFINQNNRSINHSNVVCRNWKSSTNWNVSGLYSVLFLYSIRVIQPSSSYYSGPIKYKIQYFHDISKTIEIWAMVYRRDRLGSTRTIFWARKMWFTVHGAEINCISNLTLSVHPQKIKNK